MEFEEHEVTSDHDQDGPDSDSDVEEDQVKPKKRVKLDKDGDKKPVQEKKLQVKDKAAQNFETGILDKNRIENITIWLMLF